MAASQFGGIYTRGFEGCSGDSLEIIGKDDELGKMREQAERNAKEERGKNNARRIARQRRRRGRMMKRNAAASEGYALNPKRLPKSGGVTAIHHCDIEFSESDSLGSLPDRL